DASGPGAELARDFGLCAGVGVPVRVEGRLWGVMYVGSTREEPLPAGTEARLAGVTELAATAIANAQARVELRGLAEEQAGLRRGAGGGGAGGGAGGPGGAAGRGVRGGHRGGRAAARRRSRDDGPV